MKTNITLLRGNAATPALETSGANDLKQQRSFCGYRDAQVPRIPPRPSLLMTWRTNPSSGRLECRWALDGGAATDEGVSCYDLARQAA